MRTSICAVLALLAPAAAVAADMPVKAPKAAPVVDIYSGQGFYVGGGIWGELGTVTATATPAQAARAFAAGAAGQFSVGYAKGFGNWFTAVEVSANTAGIGTGNTGCANLACSLTTQYGFEQVLKVGTSNPNLFSWLPDFNFGALLGMSPAPAVYNPLSHYYLMAGFREENISVALAGAAARQWKYEWEIGAGIIDNLSPRLSLDKWVKYKSAVGAIPLLTGNAAGSVGTNQTILAGMTFAYNFGL